MNYPMQPGYPQPPKRGPSGLKILGIVFGIVAVLFLGTCVVCAGWVKKVGKEAETAAASAQASAAKEGALFVPLLAKLASDPKSLTPKTTKPDKEETVYTYDDPKGTPLHDVRMTVQKLAGSWIIEFTATPAIVVAAFGSSDSGDGEDGQKFYAVTSGPLANAIVTSKADRWTVMSVKYTLKQFVGGEGVSSFLCNSNRVPGVTPIDTAAFRVQCENMAKAKLLAPSKAETPGLFDHRRVLTGNECGRTWASWVEGPNAFGVKIRHEFICTHDPKTNIVNLTMK